MNTKLYRELDNCALSEFDFSLVTSPFYLYACKISPLKEKDASFKSPNELINLLIV